MPCIPVQLFFSFITNSGLDLNKSRLISNGLGLFNGLFDGSEIVVTITNNDSVPSTSFETLNDIFGERNIGRSIDGNSVIVVKSDQLTKLPVTTKFKNLVLLQKYKYKSHEPSKRDSFGRDTFLETTITQNNVGVVVEEFITGTVEGGSIVSFSSSQTNSVGNT